jgi:hypothetical protein
VIKNQMTLRWRHPTLPCGFDRKLPEEKLAATAILPIKNDSHLQQEMARLWLFLGEIRIIATDAKKPNGISQPTVNTCVRCANAIFDRIAVYCNLQLNNYRRQLKLPVADSTVPQKLQNMVHDVMACLWHLRFAAQQKQICINTFDLLVRMRN